MITDEELERLLEENIKKTREEIEQQLGDIDPFLAKDLNGRFLLLDAYTALANFRASMRAKEINEDLARYYHG